MARESAGADAARLLIDGDLDGAMAAARIGRTSSSRLVRSDSSAVLAWGYLVSGKRSEAETAASAVRKERTPDPLLVIALVVTEGGRSTGAASAYARAEGVLSMVCATRVLEDHGRLDETRAEIAGSPAGLERAALRSLQVGLVALGRQEAVIEVGTRLATLGQTAKSYTAYADVLDGQGLSRLAAAYRTLAATSEDR